jgi:predicted DsbA family dithiol-disulfide isomerase
MGHGLQNGNGHAKANGAANGQPHEIDVYFDYACPYAWGTQRWLYQVKEQLGDDLKINWRIFPLEQVNAPDADFKVWERPNDGRSSTLRSFQAFAAAKRQGPQRFRKFHAALFRKRHVEGRNLAGQQVLEAAATEAGLDLEQFRNDLRADEVFAQSEQDFVEGQQEHGVFGTPTIIFENGLGAYLQMNYTDLPDDPMTFWNQFVDITANTPEVIEIKRPSKVY